jgi:hypothetical protein
MAATQPSPDAPGIVAPHRTVSYRIAYLITAAIVGLLYFWLIGIGEKHERFVWLDAGNSYYNLLGRAFAGGKLYLPLEPAPELLALRDPWDERANQKYALQDTVLFNKHYYLYHGPTPALVLFMPWYGLPGTIYLIISRLSCFAWEAISSWRNCSSNSSVLSRSAARSPCFRFYY